MRIAETEVIANKVVEWCVKNKNLGPSKYHEGLPIVAASYQSDKPDIFVEYDQDENLIQIYSKMNRTMKQLVNTTIHEFQHYLQCPTWIQRHIAKYGHKSRKNPYELQAEATALFYTGGCIRELNL